MTSLGAFAGPSGSRHRVSRLVAAAALLVLPASLLASAQGTASASIRTAADSGSAVTVSGKGEFSTLRVSVSKTQNLINETIGISWTGGVPTNVTAGGNFLTDFLQVMQCWAEPGQQPDREQCQYGGLVAAPGGGQNVASRQITQFYIDPNETKYTRPPGSIDIKYVDFDAVDGTVTTGKRSQFFDASTTNEIALARTAPDGTGRVFFEAQTGLEAPGLGCGQTINGRSPDCFLVIVPRGKTEVDGTLMGTQISLPLASTPLSTTNWANRIVVPLGFQALGAACSFGRPETPTIGSDLATEAISSWQPVLCSGGDRNFGFTSTSDEAARQVLASDDPGLVFLTKGLPGRSDVLYAPVAISALTFGVNVELPMPTNAPDGKPIGPEKVPDDVKKGVGQRLEGIKLNPRLIAKLLTQSYGFDVANGAGANVAKNPFEIARDPEFLALNPGFRPGGYSFTLPNALGRLFVPLGLTDNATVMWRYVLADKEARAFLAGQADPYGMVVNSAYKGFSEPTNTFPRADLGCALPFNAQEGFVLQNCTLDIYPYASSLGSGARQVARGDTNRRNVPRLEDIQSYGLEALQSSGSRALMALTDAPSASRYSLATVQLLNANGEYVSVSDESLTKAVSAMSPDAEGLLEPDFAKKAAGAYPLTIVAYAATRPGALSPEARADYARLLEYASTLGQERLPLNGLPQGYAPLTPSLKAQTTKAATAIANYVAPTPTPTPTPTPEPMSAEPTTEPPLTDGSGTDTGTSVPTTGPVEPSATASAAPTVSPTTTPVVAVGPTPNDAIPTSRYALLIALVVGLGALVLRVLMPLLARVRA